MSNKLLFVEMLIFLLVAPLIIADTIVLNDGKTLQGEIVDQDSLQPVSSIDRPVLVALAVRFGAARLIDNLRVDATGVGR